MANRLFWLTVQALSIIDVEATMPTFDISLPDTMQEFIGKQVEHRGYSSVSGYMRDLVRADQKRMAKEELEQMSSSLCTPAMRWQ